MDNQSCGPVSNYMGLIFIFLIFLNYLVYTIIKDSVFCCLGPLSCCDPSHVTRSVEPMPTQTIRPEVGDDVRMADLEGNYNFDLPTFEEALQMEKIDVPTMGKVNEAFEESPPEYEPPSYSDSRPPLSGEIPLAGGQVTPESSEFQPREGSMASLPEEERTVTPIIPNANQIN